MTSKEEQQKKKKKKKTQQDLDSILDAAWMNNLKMIAMTTTAMIIKRYECVR